VFEPDNHGRAAFRSAPSGELKAIAKDADIAGVWMEEVNGPVLRFEAVIPERSCKLELNGPAASDKEIRSAFGDGSAGMGWKVIQMCGDEFDQLGLPIWANTRAEGLEWCSLRVDRHAGGSDVGYKLIKRHSSPQSV
jgi:hypothetical protein